VVLINDPGFRSGDNELFKGDAMTYYGRWTYKYEEAARQGAAGILIIHETETCFIRLECGTKQPGVAQK